MGILSNFFGRRDARPAADPPGIIRPARASEIEPAVRLVLGGQAASISERHVREFIEFTRERGVDLGLLHVFERAGKLVLASLPITSPGRTMLMFTSPRPAKEFEAAASRLVDAVCAAAARKDVQLAQVLLDPADESSRHVYAAAGFESMAELIYLRGSPRPDSAAPGLPPDFRWAYYSEATHDDFVRTISDSYRESLDCPALNGVRDMRDVIEGHKSSGGAFEPRHWMLLYESDLPRGVLLLAGAGRGEEMMELVYLGLTPESRGRELGEILVRQAVAVAAAEGHARFSLAVDAKNLPALKLYYRHGMSRVTTKWAMMRDLLKNISTDAARG